MKILEILFGSLVMCLSSLPLILLILALQGEATVPPNPGLDQVQINEIQQLLIDHDPRQLLASDYQEVRLTENELNAMLTYIKSSNPQLDTLNIRAELVTDGVVIAMSIPLQAAGLVRYANITLNFSHNDDQLILDSVEAGALDIPSLLLTPMGSVAKARLGQEENYQLVATFIDSLHFQSVNEERVVILMDWQDESLENLGNQARQIFVSAREAERLLFFHDTLVETTESYPDGITRVSLNDLLRPLFLYASVNSAGGADPVAENRAVFIVMSAYLTDLELSQLIGPETELATPRSLTVVIESREDLARHVVSSAAIAASAGATMAEVLSVYKEVHDSRYRTGFSFTDIAANQAGTMLGMLASRSAADAILFQDVMKSPQPPSSYLPPLGTYDGMTEAEFIERYESRSSDAYLQRLQEITDSITTLPFYQAFVQ